MIASPLLAASCVMIVIIFYKKWIQVLSCLTLEQLPSIKGVNPSARPYLVTTIRKTIRFIKSTTAVVKAEAIIPTCQPDRSLRDFPDAFLPSCRWLSGSQYRDKPLRVIGSSASGSADAALFVWQTLQE